MVLHLPLQRELGGARIQIELAEQLIQLGHDVDFFSREDLPQRGDTLPLASTVLPTFGRRAARALRNNLQSYDVVDALEGCLPSSKRDLSFERLLVTRSLGLIERYDDFRRRCASAWPDERRGKFGTRGLRNWEAYRLNRDAAASLETADLVNVANEAEASLLNARGVRSVIALPYGLTATRRAEFREAALQRPGARAPVVAFVGYWQTRKGSRDWPTILRKVRAERPDARLLLAGTGQDERIVREAFAMEDQEHITVIPHFSSALLPLILSEADVGAFPSYVEGFGFAVIEKLAAGLPVVAYDTPGPRDILAGKHAGFLTEPGDVGDFARRVLDLLDLTDTDREDIQDAAMDVANEFDWRTIAEQTLEHYADAISSL
jgi:glycosyltransferase involved in cell wall biosynthesis